MIKLTAMVSIFWSLYCFCVTSRGELGPMRMMEWLWWCFCFLFVSSRNAPLPGFAGKGRFSIFCSRPLTQQPCFLASNSRLVCKWVKQSIDIHMSISEREREICVLAALGSAGGIVCWPHTWVCCTIAPLSAHTHPSTHMTMPQRQTFPLSRKARRFEVVIPGWEPRRICGMATIGPYAHWLGGDSWMVEGVDWRSQRPPNGDKRSTPWTR